MRKRLLIAALLLLLLAPVVFLAVVLYTETGVRFIAARVSALERIGVTIQGVSGTLAGPLFVQRFELDHPRVHVVVHDIVIEPQLRGLALQTIQTRSLRARDALIELRAADLPPSERPPQFLPRFLRVDARGAVLDRVRYVHENGTSVEANRVMGRVTITSKRLHARGFAIEAETFDAAGDVTLIAGRPFALEATASGRLRLPRETLTLEADVKGPFDRLQIDARMRAPSEVSVAALFTRPEERWKLEGEVTSPAFALDMFLDDPPLSLRNVALTVSATQEGLHATGNLGVPQFSERDFTVDARGRFSNRVLELDGADIALNETPARAHASGSIAFDGEAPTLDLAARWTSLQWPLLGEPVVSSAAGSGTLRGPLPYEFSVNAQVSSPHAPPAEGTASGVLSKEQIVVAAYDVRALGGEIKGAATLQFARPRAWTASTQATGVDPSGLHPEFPGRINLTATARGAGFDRSAAFDVRVQHVSGVLRSQRVRGGGGIERARGAWIARNVDVRYGAAHLTLDGSYGGTLDARWSLDAPALDDLLPDARGALKFRGSASGARTAPRIVATLQGERLDYAGWQVERVSLDANVDASSASTSTLTLDAARIGRGEPLIDELHVKGEGVAAEHRLSLDVTGVAQSAAEPAPRALLQATGAYEDERWTGTVTGTQLARGDGADKLELVEPAKLTASREEAVLENLCLAVSAGRVCAHGKWLRAGPWDATIAGYEIPLAFVLPPAGEEAEYAGRIEGRIRANGAPGRAWVGDAGMRIIDAAIVYRPPGAPPQTLNLGTGGLAATATPERIEFSFGIQAFSDTFLYANAQLARDGRNDILNLPLTGDMRARAADANILPVVVPEIDHAAGLLTANAAFTGTLAAPDVTGRIELANGEFDSYRFNLALRELSFVGDVSSDRLDFRGSGRAGEGLVNVDGRFAWGGEAMQGNMHLKGDNLLVADLPEYRVIASPDLRFHIEGQRMNVVGDVVIPSALLQPNELTGAVRASDDARYVGEHQAEREGRYTVHSEVRIAMGDDVRVNSFGLEGRITGSVGTTIRTGETPIGRGALDVQLGRYDAYGQELDITRGRLLFDVSPLDDPGLDIEAKRIIDTTTVGLNVRGTLQEPRLTFFSDPSMPQTQIVSYLLTGKSSEALQGPETASVRSMQDNVAMQGGGLLASQIGRRVGLDAVGVENSVNSAGESDSALVLGKFLSPRLFISYGISLTESINTLKLRYTLSERWLFRSESGENQSADVEFTVER